MRTAPRAAAGRTRGGENDANADPLDSPGCSFVFRAAGIGVPGDKPVPRRSGPCSAWAPPPAARTDEDPLRIALLLVRHPLERSDPIPEVVRLLRERGATVELLHPDELRDVAILAAARSFVGAPQKEPPLDTELGTAIRLAVEGGAVLRRRRAEK